MNTPTFIDVPIVHFSVTWWRTLHQEATVFNPELDAKIHGTMALALWIGVLAFTLLYASLLDLRYRLETLEEDRDERELEAAIADRLDMTDVGYVIAGWVITAVVLLAYFGSIVWRTRRAERSER